MKTIKIIFITVFSLACIITLVLFERIYVKSIQKVQLVENSVWVTNCYYFEMTNNKPGELLGDLTVYESVTNKTLKHYKNKTYKESDEFRSDYHNSENWLFLIPRKMNNVKLDDYVADIIIKDPEQLKEFFLNKRFITYESVKMEAWLNINHYKKIYSELSPEEFEDLVNNKLLHDLGIYVNVH